MKDSFRIEGAETVFRSYVFNVERRSVEIDEEHFERDVAVHPGAVAVLVFNDAGEIGFIRQYRASVDAELLEIPAGTRDVAGEDPLSTAQRELAEEMGLVASRWLLLGRFYNSPGWTDQMMTVFEARDIRDVGRSPAGVEERRASVIWLNAEDARRALRQGDAMDSTTALAMHRVFGTFFDD